MGAEIAVVHSTRLISLSLMKTLLDGEAAQKMGAVPWPRLNYLKLKQNNLGNAGVAALAATSMPELRVLIISFN